MRALLGPWQRGLGLTKDTVLVSPVKSIGGGCGSCKVVETCLKQIKGQFEKNSEQQLLVCVYDWDGANGCKGAPAHAYLDWMGNNHNSVALAKDYPYESIVASCQDNRLPKNIIKIRLPQWLLAPSTVYASWIRSHAE